MVNVDELEYFAKGLLKLTPRQLDLVLSMFDEEEQKQITSEMEKWKKENKDGQ